MNLDQDIRTMLRARAEGVAAAPVIPHGTVRRVRVRKTLMAGSLAVVVGAVVFGGFAASRSLSNDAAPTPPAGETREEDPTVVDFPNVTATFVSPTNGFSVNHPDRALVTPGQAKDDWDPGNEQADDGVDVVETGLASVFKGASTEVPEGSIDDWVDGITPGGCGATRNQQAEITIDRRSGWIAECPGEIDALVVASDRVYLFSLLHDRSDARAVFDAFAATIDLTPGTAVDVRDSAWVEVQMNMKATFVSPINGYSFKYLDRGGLEPAKELWDPANQPAPIDGLGGASAEYLDEFDVVETGYGAFFSSASTKVPDGVSVDEWVDEAVAKYLPAGCYVPRSQQPPTTIDGQPGTISAVCPAEVVATVVVDGRLYLFMMAHDASRDEARQVFDAWVDTIDLTPETAAAP
jgi:hypothetical protein